MKAFTLVEIIVVLAIIALGWLWLPGLFSGTSTTVSHHFEDIAEQWVARARMEAITRGQAVSFGINAGNTQCALGIISGGEFQPFAQMNLPTGIVLDKTNSSIRGSAGVVDIINSSNDFWVIWSFDIYGKPISKDGSSAQNGTLVFQNSTGVTKWRISDEGALLALP